jgi:hypothetical protein
MRLIVRPLAAEDIERAAHWYEGQAQGLGEEFLDVLGRRLADIVAAPERFPRVSARLRRAMLNRFPYAVFFTPVSVARGRFPSGSDAPRGRALGWCASRLAACALPRVPVGLRSSSAWGGISRDAERGSLGSARQHGYGVGGESVRQSAGLPARHLRARGRVHLRPYREWGVAPARETHAVDHVAEAARPSPAHRAPNVRCS